MNWSPVPRKTRRAGVRCTLNLLRAQTSCRWCGVVVRRGGCQLRCRPRHLTTKMTRSTVKSRRVAEQCDVSIPTRSLTYTLKFRNKNPSFKSVYLDSSVRLVPVALGSNTRESVSSDKTAAQTDCYFIPISIGFIK
ncbi:hypothetical protein TNCV_4415151 [Trichonephila clavipes]|uniref:Uncharacterized protein n=1 Tax=Trichonephila clavipes TaxID=2585209 RepID=A0A8X6RZ12_TRICX|nr:hypothetical protein TNCV_4415151 [Trichonephila clavipes]